MTAPLSRSHIHRFTPKTRPARGLARLARKEVVDFICECGVTSSEHLKELEAALVQAEQRVHQLHCGDDTCTDDHG